jgi:hypothetical protein
VLSRAGALAALLAAGATHAAGEDPAQLMAQLEARLLAASRVTIEAQIESHGAVVSRLRGRSELRDRNRATVAYDGEFAGQPVAVGFEADGQALELRRGAERRRDATPPQSNRAVLVGFSRMGLLHNLARLTGLQEPDHAAGGVEQWVVLDGFRPTTFPQGVELEGLVSFGFDMVVGGTPSANARLWFDPATGLPRRRQLTVHFGQADMHVVETYTRFEVE